MWLETCGLACGPISDSKHSATFPVPPNAPEAEHATAFRNLSWTAMRTSEKRLHHTWIQKIKMVTTRVFFCFPRTMTMSFITHNRIMSQFWHQTMYSLGICGVGYWHICFSLHVTFFTKWTGELSWVLLEIVVPLPIL